MESNRQRNSLENNSIFKKQNNRSFIDDDERIPAQPQKEQINQKQQNINNQASYSNAEINQDFLQQRSSEQRYQEKNNPNQQSVAFQGYVEKVEEDIENEGEEQDDQEANQYRNQGNSQKRQYQQQPQQGTFYQDQEGQINDEDEGENLNNSVILQMYISIPGQNQEAVLELKRFDIVEEVASRFARINKLDQEAQDQIIQALYLAVEDKQNVQQQNGDDDQDGNGEEENGVTRENIDNYKQISSKKMNHQCIQEEDEDEYYEQTKINRNVKNLANPYNQSKSSMSASQQKSHQGGFFDRPYTNTSVSAFTHQTSSSSIPGVRLYNMSEKKKRKREEEIKKYEKEKEEREQKEFKKVPINQKSAQMMQKKKEKGEEMDNKDFQIKDFKISMIKHYQEQKELEECTFQPKINLISRSISDCLKQQRNFKDVFNNLYFESRIKKITKDSASPVKTSDNQAEKECTFQPITNKQDKIKQNITSSFLERNKEFQEKKHLKAKNMQYLHQNVDVTTGRKLFEPNPFKNHSDVSQENNTKSIIYGFIKNKTQKKNSNEVFENLYNLSEKKKKQQIEEEKIRSQQKKPIQLSDQTNNIVEKQRKRKIEEIFNRLDDDCDGLISSNKISIECVDKEVILLLLPVLEEIDKRQLVLDFQQFYEGFNTYFNSMNSSDRHTILFGKNKTDKSTKVQSQNNYTFSPQINQKSQKLAQKRDYLDMVSQGQDSVISKIQITQNDTDYLKSQNN